MSHRPTFRYYTATTLDGFLADDQDNLDWLLSQPIDEQGAMNYTDFIGGIGALVMGATTYEWVVEHELAQGNPWPYDIPCLVFTHRDLTPAAPTVSIVAGEVTDHLDRITALAGDKAVWVVGGGGLAAQFAQAGLLDEVTVSIAPVTLGSGRPLFPQPFDLELVEVAQNRAFVCARYRVVGPRT
ncbi:dihydrofolate reductase family protein [Gordonia sp. ABSL1-1]|uniref:dihydrofolate reductase family protein n=1 Tax=Gordonia sp. ABSL1-1 TaxID=3053923 RepID=UPI00257451BC|nr:dihydrofolate reductase family protein [Gordonia sp. ABSL1-1]MDL9938804.1 dihydrofolate reductase family protein [Gordonia sp. ABSL1-1]